MVGYRKHISLVLVLGFLFPQAIISVHHFLISHNFYVKEENRHGFLKVPRYAYHSCDYQLVPLESTMPKIVAAPLPDILFAFKKESYGSRSDHINELAFHYSLRGPPDEPNYLTS